MPKINTLEETIHPTKPTIHRKHSTHRKRFEPYFVSSVYLCTMFTDQQQKWLKQAQALFLKYGIKSMTMDDVARELGISKKTLYQFVENKDDLVLKMLKFHIEIEKKQCEEQFSQTNNAIEEIMMVIEMNAKELQQMKSNIVYDLQRYHRDAWTIMAEYQQGFMYKVVLRNLDRGIAEGLYRSEINVDVMTKIHIATSFVLFDETIFPSSEYSKVTVFKEYLLHYLHGIVSEKGKTMI
jgi:TetR/AcrR family transcriptional regulator, cholesterol catabolism regulator